MAAAFRENHYVAQWYQKRFLVPGQGERLFLRDLAPREFRDAAGNVTGRARAVKLLSPRDCFAKRDLYTTRMGSGPRTDIERVAFGEIDDRGRAAVGVFSDFSVGPAIGQCEPLLNFIGAQKLRTPKGLDWLRELSPDASRDQLLLAMLGLRQLYSAVWSECVWQIADASQSETKFIISDHPVTVYNRACPPSSRYCRNANDPDVRLLGTHTIFPLSLDRILLLTNLAWARNPYQDPREPRPNPRLEGMGFLKLMDIQSARLLTETEVRQINLVIKERAYRYVAAGAEEWLYPEHHVSVSDWSSFGDGYLFMPDPRGLSMGGTVIAGTQGGKVYGSDEYGRKPGESGFESRGALDAVALERFKGEFSRLYGARRRGRTTGKGGLLQPEVIPQALHDHYVSSEGANRRRMNERRAAGRPGSAQKPSNHASRRKLIR